MTITRLKILQPNFPISIFIPRYGLHAKLFHAPRQHVVSSSYVVSALSAGKTEYGLQFTPEVASMMSASQFLTAFFMYGFASHKFHWSKKDSRLPLTAGVLPRGPSQTGVPTDNLIFRYYTKISTEDPDTYRLYLKQCGGSLTLFPHPKAQ